MGRRIRKKPRTIDEFFAVAQNVKRPRGRKIKLRPRNKLQTAGAIGTSTILPGIIGGSLGAPAGPVGIAAGASAGVAVGAGLTEFQLMRERKKGRIKL